MPDKTEKKQGKFRKGHSGNPLGRPRGIRNKATIAAKLYLKERLRESVAKPLKKLSEETFKQSSLYWIAFFHLKKKPRYSSTYLP
jgi:hypothetical protein